MAQSRKPTILVTGAGGYIGSHCTLELLEKGYNVVAVDNFHNAAKGHEGKSVIPKSLLKVMEMAGKPLIFHEADVRDKAALRQVFTKNRIDCVMHLAAMKSVPDSFKKPLQYYSANVAGSIHLLEVMEEFCVKKLVFSSSATVYGDIQYLPIDEKHPTGACVCPYGYTKYFVEQVLRDQCNIDPELNVISLRYFNPVGAHPSGLIGEDPQTQSSNLIPTIAQVSVGRQDKLIVYGTDYPTKDGTCVRDYIHIKDLAKGHLAALEKMFGSPDDTGLKAFNLSLGMGSSVLEALKIYEEVSGVKIPVEMKERREGDTPEMYADSSLAERELGWKADKQLKEMIEDVWRWQSNNPKGYK